MSSGTHQTFDKTEVKTSSRSLRSSPQKADTQRSLCQNWITLTLNRLINSTTVATDSAQETTGVRCKESCGNARKFIDGSMVTRQRCRKRCRHQNERYVHREFRMAKGDGMTTTERRWLATAMVSRERTRTRASYPYCSNRNKTRPTVWLETIQ